MRWKLFAIGTLIVLSAETAFLLARAASIPATVTTTPAVSILVQNSYRWYENIDALTPTTALAAESAAITTPGATSQLRLRMNIANDGGKTFPAGATFILQFANATSGPWVDVSATSSWAFFDDPSVADGQIIVTTLLASSTVGESYGESNPTAAMPANLLSGDYGEWDWTLVNVSAATAKDWFFRLVNASGTPLDRYAGYPELMAVTPPPSGGSSGGGSVVQVGAGGSTGRPSSATPPQVPSTTASTTVPIVPPGQICPLPSGQPTLPPKFQRADFNCDGRIDITDLSILLYYYGQSGPQVARYDLNGDGSIGIDDISILMYYWTGP